MLKLWCPAQLPLVSVCRKSGGILSVIIVTVKTRLDQTRLLHTCTRLLHTKLMCLLHHCPNTSRHQLVFDGKIPEDTNNLQPTCIQRQNQFTKLKLLSSIYPDQGFVGHDMGSLLYTSRGPAKWTRSTNKYLAVSHLSNNLAKPFLTGDLI